MTAPVSASQQEHLPQAYPAEVGLYLVVARRSDSLQQRCRHTPDECGKASQNQAFQNGKTCINPELAKGDPETSAILLGAQSRRGPCCSVPD
jgi:hypothetical protein